MKNQRGSIGFGALIIMGLVAAVVVISSLVYFTSIKTTDYTNCVVTEKDRSKNSDNSSDARIYTEDCGVFKVADSFLKGEFSSANTYGAIKVGKTYDFTTVGFRSGLLSEFPNIVEYTPVG